MLYYWLLPSILNIWIVAFHIFVTDYRSCASCPQRKAMSGFPCIYFYVMLVIRDGAVIQYGFGVNTGEKTKTKFPKRTFELLCAILVFK